MSGEFKITPGHLSRRAVVYVRQSSEMQVKNNLESQRLQYAMVDRAHALGFRDVDVIDIDLGASAGVASKRRAGFEQLLGSVALREIGIVLSRELSRLSRTDKDFCQLVELCQLFETLVGDEEAVYDPRSTDDQLVLGIKATLSAVELSVLRLRLVQGQRAAAARGALYPRLPAGYVWDGDKVVKHPNVRVRESMELIFRKFRETWSIRQTFKWFFDNDIELPVSRPRPGSGVLFQIPTHSFIAYVLHSPFYAGAYTWGRRPTEVVWQSGELRKRQAAAVPPEQARVFLREHHEGYIGWAAYEEHQRMIERNNWRGHTDETAGVARAGNGLFSGLLRCGHCGRKLQIRYWGKSGTAARYLCGGDYLAGGRQYCIGFGGTTTDRRLGEEVVRVISPLGLRASLEALEGLSSQEDEEQHALQRQLAQKEYEAKRAFEQYDEVDARNRLVAAELERRWNAKLEDAGKVRARLQELSSRRHAVSAEEKRALLLLGEHFADVWQHEDCPIELKKQIVRTVLEEIIVREDPPGRLIFVLRWKGGSHTQLEMQKSNSAQKKTAEEDIDVIRKMAPRYGDDQIAIVLSKLGRRTAKGRRWSRESVKSARSRNGIAGRRHTIVDPEVLSLQGAVRYTGTSDRTIQKLVDGGVLPMQQVVPFAPWEIKRTDLDSAPVRAVLEQLKRTGRVVLEAARETQEKLFE